VVDGRLTEILQLPPMPPMPPMACDVVAAAPEEVAVGDMSIVCE